MNKQAELEQAYRQGFEQRTKEAQTMFDRWHPKKPGAIGNITASTVNLVNKLKRELYKARSKSENIAISLGELATNPGSTFKGTPDNNSVIPALGGAAIGALLTGGRDKEDREIIDEEGNKKVVETAEPKPDHIARRIANALLGGAMGYTASKGYYRG